MICITTVVPVYLHWGFYMLFSPLLQDESTSAAEEEFRAHINQAPQHRTADPGPASPGLYPDFASQ